MKPKPSEILIADHWDDQDDYFININPNCPDVINSFTKKEAKEWLNKLDMGAAAIEALKDIAYWSDQQTEIWGDPANRAKTFLDNMTLKKEDENRDREYTAI